MNRIITKIKNNQIIFFLILINGLGVLSGSLLSPIEAIYLGTLTDYKILVGLTFSVGTICIFIFSLLMGRLSHYIRRRKLIIFGLALGILYPLIYASALNVYQYMFGRSIWAFSSVASGVIVSAFFQDLISKKENIAELSGIKSSFNAIVGTVGAILGGFLADTYGLSIPFYAVMFLYVISLIIFISYVYPKIKKLPPSKPRKKSSFRAAYKDIIKNPFLFLRIFLEGITQSHWAMEPIVFPILIYNLTGRNLATGLVFGLMGVIAMITLPMAGRYVDNTTSEKALKITFILYGIAFLIMVLSKNIFIFTAGAIILSLGKSFNGPAFERIETEKIAEESRIEYLSYFKAYDTLTAAITCLVVGLLLDLFSPQKVILFYAMFTIIGGYIGFMLFNFKNKKYIA